MGKKIDLTGQRFGKLTVIKEVEPCITNASRRVQWLCKCDCGNECKVTTFNLRRGHTKSCGCYKKEWAKENVKTHGMSDTKLYTIWTAMKRRCSDSNIDNPKYHRYAGRGIKVCDEWNSPDGFNSFYKWAIENGYEEGLTIDRIDNDGNYEPSNCRWATREQQMNNVSYNVKIEYNGVTKTIAEWSKLLNLKQDTIQSRIKYYNMSIYDALFKPPTCEKQVDVYTTNHEYIGRFENYTKASEYIGCNKSSITQCIKGTIKTTHGYICKPVEVDYIIPETIS